MFIKSNLSIFVTDKGIATQKFGIIFFFYRAGERNSSRSADRLLRRAGGVAGVAPLP